MTNTATPNAATGTASSARPGRWSPGRIAGAMLALIAVAAIAFLAVLTAGQSGQFAALGGDVAAAQHAASTAEQQAKAASSAVAQAGKTQAAADNANLGVCVDVTYGSAGYVQSMSVTSPVKSKGGAVSCYAGTFTPVTPQPAVG